MPQATGPVSIAVSNGALGGRIGDEHGCGGAAVGVMERKQSLEHTKPRIPGTDETPAVVLMMKASSRIDSSQTP